jgi:hypothetical protein
MTVKTTCDVQEAQSHLEKVWVAGCDHEAVTTKDSVYHLTECQHCCDVPELMAALPDAA